MLTIISPAKTLDFDTAPYTEHHTTPALLDHTMELVTLLRSYDADAITALMKVSEKIANLNVERYQHFSLPFTSENAKQALLAFKGDVYTPIETELFTQEDYLFAQSQLRILSGLYGILRPLDLMQPYRLEMGTTLTNERGKNLYEFWGSLLTEQLNQTGESVLINLASKEYFSAIQPELFHGEIIDITFKEKRNEQYKIIALLAKKARGKMVNSIIRNRITQWEDLLSWEVGEYGFSETMSSLEGKRKELVFIR